MSRELIAGAIVVFVIMALLGLSLALAFGGELRSRREQRAAQNRSSTDEQE